MSWIFGATSLEPQVPSRTGGPGFRPGLLQSRQRLDPFLLHSYNISIFPPPFFTIVLPSLGPYPVVESLRDCRPPLPANVDSDKVLLVTVMN